MKNFFKSTRYLKCVQLIKDFFKLIWYLKFEILFGLFIIALLLQLAGFVDFFKMIGLVQ